VGAVTGLNSFVEEKHLPLPRFEPGPSIPHYYYYYYCGGGGGGVVSCHTPFIPGTPLEPAVIPTAQVSSFRLQYFPCYV
jgi:hypothetical protein